jgi:hypothetical protein
MIPEETLQLLRAIYRGQCEGYLTLTAIHPDKQQRTPSRHLHICDKEAIHQSLKDLLRANGLGWGAYFSVALRKQPLGRWKRGGESDLLALPALYADLDGDLSESFERIRKSGMAGMPSASAMIGSGRGLHLHWVIEPTDDFVTANRVLAGLAKQLGGDEVRVTQALRLPGSRNTKPEVNRACKLLWLAEDRRYKLDDFAAFAEPQKPPSSPLMKRNRAPPTSVRSSSGDFNPNVIHAVENALIHDLHGFVQPNRWLGSFCPLPHQSDAPGKHFALHPSGKFGVCLGKHQVLKLIDLCRILNIDPASYGGLYRK